MNRLEPADASDRRWRLPAHAHVVVYERDADGTTSESGADGRDDRGLLTIYDCGAAAKPPSAQLLGTLAAVDARAEVESAPTGRIVRLRERAVLVEGADDRYRIVRPAEPTR